MAYRWEAGTLFPERPQERRPSRGDQITRASLAFPLSISLCLSFSFPFHPPVFPYPFTTLLPQFLHPSATALPATVLLRAHLRRFRFPLSRSFCLGFSTANRAYPASVAIAEARNNGFRKITTLIIPPEDSGESLRRRQAPDEQLEVRVVFG